MNLKLDFCQREVLVNHNDMELKVRGKSFVGVVRWIILSQISTVF